MFSLRRESGHCRELISCETAHGRSLLRTTRLIQLVPYAPGLSMDVLRRTRIVVRRIRASRDEAPLVREPQSKLHSTRQTALMIHHTERGAETYSWFCELRMVEQVKYLAAEL